MHIPDCVVRTGRIWGSSRTQPCRFQVVLPSLPKVVHVHDYHFMSSKVETHHSLTQRACHQDLPVHPSILVPEMQEVSSSPIPRPASTFQRSFGPSQALSDEHRHHHPRIVKIPLRFSQCDLVTVSLVRVHTFQMPPQSLNIPRVPSGETSLNRSSVLTCTASK